MEMMTLFGPKPATKVCNTCGEEKEVEKFHFASSTTARHNEQRRSQCKKCWHRHNGRSNFSNVATFEVR
jgi:recombinational DNA repair protein (RecF pathway)